MSDRIPTQLWLEVHLRQWASTGRPYYMIHKGCSASGTVLVKLLLPGAAGAKVLTQARTAEGDLGWLTAFAGQAVPEAEADAYIQRQIERDPDLWAVELESADGTHPFEGLIIP